MSKIGIIFLCVILFPNTILARQLRVDLVGKHTDLAPGKIHTLVFNILNDTDHATSLQPDIKLPAQWVLVSALTDISLSAHESQIYLVQVHIPSTAQKGAHELELMLNRENAPVVSTVFELSVKQVQKISVQSISTIPYVKAGDTIRQIFVVKNEGNHLERIQLEISPDATIVGETMRSLEAGEVTEVHVVQTTDLRAPRPVQKSLKLTAYSINDEASIQEASSNETASVSPTGVYAYSRTEVIPTYPVEEDIYHRVPIQVSSMYIARERAGDFRQAWQGEIYGKGSLDERHLHQLEFRAIGPDRFELTTFTPYEEYFINYRTKDFLVHVGDQVYSSSLLTEFARYGRGLELRKGVGDWEVGGFYNRPRFYKGIRDEINLYTRYQFNPSSQLRYGYLMKRLENTEETHHLQFLEGETQLFKHIHLKGEYAISQGQQTRGYGWNLQARANFRNVHASASYLDASPNFAGYYSNTHFFNSHINYRMTPKLTFHGNFQQDARNFRRDTLYGTAPYRERVQVGLRFNYLRDGTIGAYAGWHVYEDRHTSKQFHYEEQFIRLDLHQKIQNWGVNLQTHVGETNNFLIQYKGISTIYSTQLSYQLQQHFFSLFGSYSQSSRYQNARHAQFLYGGRINSNLSDQWNISAFYQNSYYLEDYYADRNLFELLVNYRVTPRHSFHLISRYAMARQQLDHKDFSMQLRYTFHFGMPVRKVKRYGSLAGRIANLSGAQLRLGSQTALVDASGAYSFRNVPPGLNYLEIAPGSLGLKEITDVQLPVRVQIEEGENHFDFGVTQAARIKGQIQLSGEDSLNNAEASGEIGRVVKRKSTGRDDRVIVEVSSEKEVYRKIIDIREGFDFTYLRPGDWKLKIYRNGLDSAYKIVRDVFDLTLNPGEEKEVLVEIEKSQRTIQFLQPPIQVGAGASKK